MIVMVILLSSLMRKYISRLYRTKTSNKAVQVCEAQLNAANLALKGNFFTVCMFLLSPYAKEFPSTWWVKDSMFCLNYSVWLLSNDILSPNARLLIFSELTFEDGHRSLWILSAAASSRNKGSRIIDRIFSSDP